jgi:hypothetical protein
MPGIRVTALTAPIIEPTALTRVPVSETRPPGDTGPWAEETSDSRIGIQSGLDGAKNVTRTMRVFTANPGDNPIQTIESLPPTRGGFTTLSRFPTAGGWGDGSYVCYNFAILDHWQGTNVWILQANYVPSYVAAIPTEKWTFRMQSSLESETVFADLDGKETGVPNYQPYMPLDLGPPAPATKFYATSLNPAYPQALLQLADGSADPTAKSLPRHVVGVDRPRRTSVFSITKTLPEFLSHLPAVSWAANNEKAVNNDSFFINTTAGVIPWVYVSRISPLGGTPVGFGTVLFQDMTLEPIINEAGGAVPSYRITLTFKYDPGFYVTIGGRRRWFPPYQYHRAHLKKWDDGSESPIIYAEGALAGQPVWESWRMVDSVNMSDLVGRF